MGSIGSAASCAVGICFGVLSVGTGIAGGFCLAHAKKIDDIFDQCCGEYNQYNNKYPCPEGGLKERAVFCKHQSDSTDTSIKIGSLLVATGIGFCCLAMVCGVLSSVCKRQGYHRMS